MILVAAIAGVLFSVVALRGDLHRLATIRLRGRLLVAGAAVLQVSVIEFWPSTLPHELAPPLHLASYGLAVAFLWANRRLPGLWLIGAGGFANLIAISANGGVMPASASA